MLTGGYNYKTTEVIDLIDGTKSCTNLEDFPADDPFSLNKGGVVNGQPIVCADKDSKKCYKMTRQGSWTHFATLNKQGYNGAGVVIKGNLEGNDEKLWMIPSSVHDESEYVYSNGSVEMGPKFNFDFDCAVQLENGKILLLGGNKMHLSNTNM